MYSDTFTSIKLPNGITDSFKTNRGIRQGDGLSPLLFCLFMDDIKSIFDESCDPCKIGNLDLNHLIYADDLVLLSETKLGLQHCLNKLDEYCLKWKLKVNLSKTKIVIFRPSGRIPKCDFYLSGHSLEIVKHFKYLGLTLTSNGSFKAGISELVHKAQKAWYGLRSKINFELWNNPAILLKLYDSMIRPIALYGTEVWSQQFAKQLSDTSLTNIDNLDFEKFNNKICKQILGVGKYSVNLASRLELGRMPLSIFIVKQTLNYWSKLENAPENSLLKNCLHSEKEIHNRKILSWYTLIDNVCKQFQFNNNHPVQITKKQTYKLWSDYVKSHDNSTLNYLDMVKNSTEGFKLRTYAKFKCNTNIEQYLLSNLSRSHKRIISKFRIGEHKLHVETGRHRRPKTPLQLRTCRCCNLLEDETHFLMGCSLYDNIRSKYTSLFQTPSSPSRSSFINIMNNTENVHDLSNFLEQAFIIRSEYDPQSQIQATVTA